MRIYIHNVGGYVGSALSHILAEGEHEVIGSYYEENVSGGESSVGGSNKSVTELASVSDLDKVNELILSSDTIIFAAAEPGALDHTRAALRLLKRGGYEGTKQFILLSSVMTWARTKLANETAETGLREETYTKRKAAASCSQLKTLETQTMALARENLQTCVIAPGMLYGAGENALHALFRQAWLCKGPLPIVHSTRGGANVLPMIHVKDMARVVSGVVASQPDSSYVVAVDKSRNTLRDVVSSISSSLGLGGTKDLTREETQELMLSDPDVGALNMHIFFDAESTTSNTMGIEWGCEEGFVTNIDSVVTEYKNARDLRPVRLVVCGPPACGPTQSIAERLAQNYFVPLITPASALAAALYEPPAPVPVETKEGDEEAEEAPEPPEPTPEEVAASELREEVKAAGDNIPDTLMCRVVNTLLSTRPCQNQGWILQGYPKTWREATGLWAAGELEEGGADDVDPEAPLPEGEETGKHKPTGVVLLDGADEWLLECAMEAEMKEEEFNGALSSYRTRNADDNERSPASFFESVLRVDTISHTVDSSTSIDQVLDDTYLAVEKGGKPFNYHPTPEEEAESLRTALAEQKRNAETQAEAAEQKRAEEEAERTRRETEQARRLEEIKQQEEELLEARSAPLRAYLMKHVIPTLTEGLIETCKVMPEDPVDYLAEFMFRASPAVETKTGKK
jgi:adenylate kinase